ncbi:MAG: ribonuclease P protein component [Proteobacteria bacterium]|nr:ribonuclease P protein component [Pseudomonadota bacterium]
MSGQFSLPARLRLRAKGEFDRAYGRGRRLGDGYFGMTVVANPAGYPRLGLAVAVRVAGNGVRRNRIRRIIRESFRLHRHELPAVDVVVSARPLARDARAPQLHASLLTLWKRITDECATSPPP